MAKFDDAPFDIPESWRWVNHNALIEIVGGSQPAKAHFVEAARPGYVRLYQTRDYGPHPVPVFVDKTTVNKFTNKGDILLARYGASLGKVFVAEDGAYNVALAKVVILHDGVFITKYLYYYYQSSIYQNFAKNTSRSAQAGFNKDDLSVLYVPIPPLIEQQTIVDKLEIILPLIETF